MQPIAVIGLSCLFPEANTPEEYRQNLIQEKDSRTSATVAQMEVDPERFFDSKKGTADKFYCTQGGYIHDFSINPEGYKISPEHVAKLGNTFQWPLHVAREALRESGYLDNDEVLKKCGVVLGNLSFPTKASNHLLLPLYQKALEPLLQNALGREDFHLRAFFAKDAQEHTQKTRRTFREIAPENASISGLPAAMIARALGLSARSFALDAACASSLYAVALGAYYLNSGKTDLMLAGAVSAADPFFVNMGFSIFQAYPETQQNCQPLDQNSGGLFAAEGAGMFVLKRLEDAKRDGDRIHAVVSGIGLSNDGRGQFVLSPNSKGQVLAYERAYASAEVSPEKVDYVECHATGTPLGDKVELNSMEQFFAAKNAKPLIGSVKSNLGHMLTNAGMGGMIKVILALQQGQIPATIGVENAMSSKNNGVSAGQVVRKTTAWPHKNPQRRAAVSAFGFGGTNAHLIFDLGIRNYELGISLGRRSDTDCQPLAIIGMEVIFGGCNGLREFYETLYEGKQHFRKLPPERWKGLEQHPELKNVSQGAWLEAFEMDYLRFKLQPNPQERLIPQQLLTLEVTDRAIKKTKLCAGQNVAVLVAMETELELHRFRGRVNLATQIEDSLKNAGIVLDESEQRKLISTAKDSLLAEVRLNQFTGFIGNIMATRISSLWDFSGPSLTISSEENSVFRALEVAQMLLESGDVEAVVVTAVDLAGSPEQVFLRQKESPLNSGKATLSFGQNVNGWMIGEGAGTVILKTPEAAKKSGEQIFALLDSVAFASGISAESVSEAAKQALEDARFSAEEIGILEVFGSGKLAEDSAEMSGLAQVYSGTKATCALGGVKANIGHTFAASGMAGLIKTALCLHHRFIPAVPEWSAPKTDFPETGAFYMPTESRPWLMQSGISRRHAAISGLGQDKVCSHLILSEAPAEQRQKIESEPCIAETNGLSFFPLRGQDLSGIRASLTELQNGLQAGKNLPALARRFYDKFQNEESSGRPGAAFSAVLLGKNRTELEKEISAAQAGIEKSFAGGKDWSSPKGSSFTVNPLGREGKVAFTYPGGFSSYIGTGRSLFQMYPGLHDLDQKYFDDTGPADERSGKNYLADLMHERRLFPRSTERLTESQLDDLQENFIHTPIAMFESGVAAGVLNTRVMREGFGLEPNMAFGYSMGEITMLFGLGVWGSMANMSNPLNSSILFHERLAGPMNAVREAWKLGPDEFRNQPLWGCYTIRVTPEEIQNEIKDEPYVYLILINTPEEVVIAGEPTACKRVIQKLGRPIHPIPVTDVVHCEPVKTEYEEIKRIHTDKIVEHPEIDFYSAIDYGVSPLESETWGHNIATIYGQTVDYSKLIETTYADGARIFVDMGPRVTCAKWISKTLGKRPHLSISVNRKGKDDVPMILQALSRLLSHQVPLNLNPLFPPEVLQPTKQLPQKITLGGKPLENYDTNYELSTKQDYIYQSKIIKHTMPLENRQPSTANHQAEFVPSFSPFPGAYGSRRNAAHASFLKVRRQGMLQLANLIGKLSESGFSESGFSAGTSAVEFQDYRQPSTENRQPERGDCIFDYQDLLELAGGDISKVFGPEYTEIDSYRRYVRLPMEPYLLVSRVTKLDGKLGEFKPSAVSTEYDIPQNAWYTTDGQIPWAVAVESGQCDLLLISYLGIDFECKGEQVYRLLDCTLTYLDDMPLEGQTLRYDISINSFARHDQNLLFFFNYECFVGDKMVLRMDGGCAGFFSDEDLAQGRGVIHTAQELEVKQDAEKVFFPPLLHCPKTAFTRQELLEISNGNPSGCFGPEYNQQGKNPSLKNAPDQFLMSDRVLSVETQGGPYGLGLIVAEKDLAPDDWYFPCHFKDDPVMAGSLMAEGCVQLLQFYLLHLGLQTLVEDATFQPIHDLPQIVRCRGQVIPGDPKMTYRVEVKEIGMQPHPYAIADIDILVEGRIVVDFRDLGVQLAEKSSLLRVTKKQRTAYSGGVIQAPETANRQASTVNRNLVANEQMIWEFALGDVEKCFGSDFAIYRGRSMQRNPNSDLQLLSRVYDLQGTRMEIDKPMSLVSEYDVPKDAWYFRDNSHPQNMPYSVLMEIALQPCGFISTHSGAILTYPEIDLCYRNLDGNGTLSANPDLRGKTIVNEITLLTTVASGNTIIQTHKFSLSCEGQTFYEGDTVFGYFTRQALADQVGLDGGKKQLPWLDENPSVSPILLDLTSADFRKTLSEPYGENLAADVPAQKPYFRLCGGQLTFSDQIHLVPEGGKYGKGYAYARKEIDPQDWFFPCHFHEDPVMPGSLGVEAIIQALQAFALQQGLGDSFRNPRFSPVLSKVTWKYRGQIIPQNKFMQLEVHLKSIKKNDGQSEPDIILSADANLWREDLRIYEISDIVVGISASVN